MSEQNKFENIALAAENKTGGSNKKHRPKKRGHYRGGKHNANKDIPPQNEAVTNEADVTEPIDEEVYTPEDSTPYPLDDVTPEADSLSDENTQSSDSSEEMAERSADEAEEMTEVIGVRFRSSGKIYYFDNCSVQYPLGSHAIVDTARGMEYGEVAMSNRMVPTSELVLPLREALRIATPEDDRHYLENKAKEAEASEIWAKKVAQHGLEMKLIDTECTFDNSKLLFYFTAEGRVDFRDLVKDLASVFRCRIELRQMGIRDEAKILGGLGVCGRPFCCHSFLPDFVQVSIKMAKEQNLSLNSAKISGACGRLMCCLRYEYDTYLEEAKLTPKVDTLVKTPDGVGTVIETKPLLGLVKVQLSNSPDAPAVVYSRDLIKAIKPGEVITEPVAAPTPVPQPKDKNEKPAEKAEADPASKRQIPPQKKHRPEYTEKKKPIAPSAPAEPAKSAEKPVQGEKEPPKKEHKYSIQRACDNTKSDGANEKKAGGRHHYRKNHHARDHKEKQS